MSSYTPGFIDPYPSGWQNYPNVDTPIMAQALQKYTDGIKYIENFLEDTNIDPTTIPTLPTASEQYLDTIYQYAGPTTLHYTNGYFYKCIYDEYLESYRWVNIQTQPPVGLPTAAEVSYDNHVSGLSSTDVQGALDTLAEFIADSSGMLDVINGEVI